MRGRLPTGLGDGGARIEDAGVTSAKEFSCWKRTPRAPAARQAFGAGALGGPRWMLVILCLRGLCTVNSTPHPLHRDTSRFPVFAPGLPIAFAGSVFLTSSSTSIAVAMEQEPRGVLYHVTFSRIYEFHNDI